MKLTSYKAVIVALVAFVVCLVVYLPALDCDFVNWDDPLYIIDNTGIRILDWRFIMEALTTSYLGWWMPLTWISLAVDYHCCGLDPFGYHLTNILLHAGNTALVVLVADELLKGRRELSDERVYLYPATLLLAGLLWGLHPLRVESVAWITERKDVLNGIFSLSAVFCYLRYVRIKESSGSSVTTIGFYTVSLLLLLLSLMSKPVSVVMPAMLLVMDWYPLKRFQRGRILQLLLEKIPFVVIVSVVTFATIYFASGNDILVSYQDFPLSKRFLLAGNSLFEYLRLTFYPVDIVHLYLLPPVFPVSYAIKSTIILIFSIFCVWQCRRNAWIPATAVLFLLPLLPVLGFFQNGAQSHAARFTYLPGIALSICTAAFLGVVFNKIVKPAAPFSCVFPVALVVFLLPLIVYTLISERHLAAWKNSETLWSRIIAIRPVGRAYYLRADYLSQQGRYLEASEDLLKSINMGKEAGYTLLFNLHALRGDALSKAGLNGEAVQEFTRAISLSPTPNYYYHRGMAHKALGDIKAAEADLLLAGEGRGPIEWRSFK